MKRKGKLLVLTVALLVLVGAWLLAESTAGRLAAKQEETAAQEPETIVLSAGVQGDIRGLTWSRDGESVALRREAESEEWVNAVDSDCPIDGVSVETLAAAAVDVTGLMSITGVTDFAQYGLDAPVLTLTVEMEDHSVTYEVGSETITGEYYLRVDGGDTVYTESGALLAAFSVGLEDVLAFESLPEDVVSVESLTVTSAAESYELLRQAEGSDLWYGSAYEWYASRNGEWSPVAAESAVALCAYATGLSFQQCVDWHEENFAAYGLYEPQAEVVAVYTTEEGTQESLTIRFGRYEDDLVYVNIAGSEIVYLASGTVLDGLMYPDWDAMTPLTVCPVDMTTVTGFTVELGGHSYEVDIYTETTEEVDTEGNIELLETDYYVANGWTLDSDDAEAWLETLTTLTAESLAGDAQGREELISVTFRLDNEQWPEVSVSVWSYDSTRCLCLVNGTDGYFLSRTQGENLVTEAEKLLVLE